MDVLAGGLTATATLIAAMVGLLRYFNYRTRRDKQAAVGHAFSEVVHGLSSDDHVQRIASAILLRRFLDPRSEYGVAGLPYARDAVRVIAAVLRQEPTGHLQKILADGLAHARSLEGADLQRTNLRDAYLGRSSTRARVDLASADLHRADLSGASLKGARAASAVFLEARLVRTVLTDADLRGANFTRADLRGARFHQALLAGATFMGARNVQAQILDRLDTDARFMAGEDEVFQEQADAAAIGQAPSVFLSMPSVVTAPQRAVGELVVGELERVGATVQRIPRSSYGAAAPLSEISANMRCCDGAVILGLPQLAVTAGQWRAGTHEHADVKDVALSTPWNQIEAGIAAGLGLPLLVIRSEAGDGGVFDLQTEGLEFVQFDLGATWDLAALRSVIQSWCSQLRDT